jgi:AraC family transcriptional regulator
VAGFEVSTEAEIALACGFASSSDFSRSFKQCYGVPPRDFDVSGFRDDKRDKITPGRARLPAGENPDGFTAFLRDHPSRFVAYIRARDCFTPGVVRAAAERLVRWAEGRGYAQGQWLGYMWDDPQVVAMDQCRYDIGVEVPQPIHADGEVGCVHLPAMKVAKVEIRGGIDLEVRAIDWFYGTWLPNSSFVPDDQPSFEAFHGLPFAHGDEYFELDGEFPIVARGQPL